MTTFMVLAGLIFPVLLLLPLDLLVTIDKVPLLIEREGEVIEIAGAGEGVEHFLDLAIVLGAGHMKDIPGMVQPVVEIGAMETVGARL